jgi:hypothetical protein
VERLEVAPFVEAGKEKQVFDQEVMRQPSLT